MSNVKNSDTRMSMVYAIRCKKNGRIYVGITFDLTVRVITHFRELEHGTKGCTKRSGNTWLWQEDYNKYGRDAFEVYVIEENIPASERRKRESYYIEKYGAAKKGRGYNKLTERIYEPSFDVIRGEPPMCGSNN